MPVDLEAPLPQSRIFAPSHRPMLKILKSFLKSLPIAFTRNQRYDIQTRAVIQRFCSDTSCCVDVGCHKGEVLDIMRQAAPEGHHFGFEPIPDLFHHLQAKYQGSACTISAIALSDKKGTSTFNYVVSNPSYSGLVKRDYDRPNEKDTTITVQTDRLDDVLPADQSVDLIKIDVEGGELLVLTGARQTLTRNRPVVIFEHGMGAAEHYGSSPDQVYDFLSECGLQVSLMSRWLNHKAPLTREAFIREFTEKRNYYFIAYSDQKPN